MTYSRPPEEVNLYVFPMLEDLNKYLIWFSIKRVNAAGHDGIVYKKDIASTEACEHYTDMLVKAMMYFGYEITEDKALVGDLGIYIGAKSRNIIFRWD